MPMLRQDDAVRLAALLVMLFLFTAVGFVGYVMAVTKPPQHNKSKNTSELFFPGPGWPSSQAAACRAALQGCKSPPRLSPTRLWDGNQVLISDNLVFTAAEPDVYLRHVQKHVMHFS